MEVEGEEGGVTTRIFVGGLGGSVTAEDLEKTFSSLGVIKDTEIVRTNGRSFAYMDFKASSAKSLSKLFSMYNGCTWKGGKLRLEKAKEHYLARLQKEWEEDAELARNEELNCKKREDQLIADKIVRPPEKSKSLAEEKLSQEKMQVNIFFPGLRKVKSLPYRGSGKHKYSFQRIEVPSLPIHFCDCEEHCHPSETAKQKHVHAHETHSDAENEEELNLMRSVMNRILKRENNSEAEYDEAKEATEGDESNQPSVDVLLGENEAGQDTISDDLVINMVNGESEKLSFLESQGTKTIPADRESKFSRRQLSDDGPVTNKLKAHKRKDPELSEPSNPTPKKARLIIGEENNQDEITPSKSVKQRNSKTLSEESTGVAKGQPSKQNESIQQSNKRLSWTQKSSWKKMVGEATTNAFRISHILPDVASKENLPESDGLRTASLSDGKQENIVKQSRSKSAGKALKDLGLGQERSVQENATAAAGSTMAPFSTTSKNLEDLSEAGHKRSIHQSSTREQKLKDKVNAASGSTSEPSNTLDEESEGPSEAGERQNINQSTGKEGSLQDEVSKAGDTNVPPFTTTSNDFEGQTEAIRTDQNTSIPPSTGSVSWIQKSSWRELVGETNYSSFSISHILPGVGSTARKVQDPKNPGTSDANGSKQNKFGDGSTFVTGKEVNLQNKVNATTGFQVSSSEKEDGTLAGFKGECSTQGNNPKNEKDGEKSSSKLSESRSTAEPSKRAMTEASIGEVCTFMRSAASEKEWMKAKAALSVSLKKKGPEK